MEGIPLYDSVEHDIWYDITEGYFEDSDYDIQFNCRFHFWLVLLGATSDKEDEKEYLNHEDYTPVITRRDEHHWDIGVKKQTQQIIINP